MASVLFYEEKPVVQNLLEEIRLDKGVIAAVQKEQELRQECSQAAQYRKQVFEGVQQVMGLDFMQAMNNPEYRLITSRVASTFDEARQGSSQIDPYSVAQRFVAISTAYMDKLSKAYQNQNLQEQEYPYKLMQGMVEWIDLGVYNHESEKPKLVFATELGRLGVTGYSMFDRLKNICDSEAKAFMLGNKRDIGKRILDVARANQGQGYPYHNVMERGGWDLEYFVGEYVRRSGYAPHQSVIMSFIEQRGKKPFCRIAEQGNKWMVKIDFGKEGWNPED